MMEKIVGKIFFIFFVLLSTVTLAEITLDLRDIDGNRTKYAGVGKPFLLDVHMSSQGGTLRYPIVEGIENFAAHKSGFQLNTINGAATATYTYQVRIDKPGTYVLGPAHFTTAHGVEKSEPVKITIVEKLQKNQFDKTKQAFLQLKANKQQVFVGEKIHCSLRFYYNNNRINIHSIGGPDENTITSAVFGKHTGPIQGKEKIDGTLYDYIEWHWDMVATQSGTLTVPAYYIDYHIESRDAHNRLAGLISFFGRRAKQKRTYSNALIINVETLPPTDKEILGVGTIESFSASLKPSAAKQGEGMVLTLQVKGDIDLASLNIKDIQLLPESFKWYESKQQVTDDTKSFEFIMQGFEPGDWYIPSQQLTYFDVIEKKYKTIFSDSLAITIIEDRGFETGSLETQTTVDVDNKSVLQPLDYSDVWYRVEEKSIAWPWFIGILLLAFLIWSIYLIRLLLRNDSKTIQKKYAFAHARKKLQKAAQENNVNMLYPIFMYALAARMERPLASLSQKNIEQLLRKSGFDEQQIDQWNDFFVQLEECSFSPVHKTQHIFAYARQWLDKLEDML